MTHYPVTTSFWRGVWNKTVISDRQLRRACDWHKLVMVDADENPTCTWCAWYKYNLQRLGVLR